MSNQIFNFKQFLIDYKLTGKNIAERSGLGVNTITKWLRLKTDANIQQESILKLIKGYPETDFTKYFPTHAEIIMLYKNQESKIKK